MSNIQIIMFCTVVLAITACVIHNSTKTIAAMLYRRMVTGEVDEPKPKRKSPYGVLRQKGTSGWGLAITKNGDILRENKYSSYPIYNSIKAAQKDINLYELQEGYELTKYGEDNE